MQHALDSLTLVSPRRESAIVVVPAKPACRFDRSAAAGKNSRRTLSGGCKKITPETIVWRWRPLRWGTVNLVRP